MVILRPTRKVGALDAPSVPIETASSTALGDWYLNRVHFGRRPLLLAVSSTSLLPMLLHARDVRSLPARFAGCVAGRLRRLGVSGRLVEAELAEMEEVRVAPTLDRSVLGILVEFCRVAPYYLDGSAGEVQDLERVEEALARTPCHAGRRWEEVVWPDRAARDVLARRWSGG